MNIIFFLIIIFTLLFIIKEILSYKKFKIGFSPLSAWFSTYPSLTKIIILGITLRLLLATTASTNFDMHIFMTDAQFFLEGKYNIYFYNWNHTYSPAIFYIAGFLGIINKTFVFLPYPFLQRAYISFIDVLTLFVLIAIAKKQNISPTRTAVFFFLNPVTILLSGYHAQFDNNAVFFLLLAVWLQFYSNFKQTKWKIISWFLLTIGFIIKHITPFQVFLVELSFFKKNSILKGSLLFILTLVAFLSTILPFANNSESQFVIKEYVLGYQGQSTISGVTGIIRYFCVTCQVFDIRFYALYKYIFLIGGMVFSLFLIRKKNLLLSLLVSFLFFLTFSSAHAPQYFVLPLAIGALFPSRWFILYTTVITILLLAFQVEVGLSIYIKVFLINVGWVTASFWFFAELIKTYRPAENVYKRMLLFVRKPKAIKK